MNYEGVVIRPPSEADSLLLQATVGCSHNRCTFCGTYKGERFRIKPDAVVAADIEDARLYRGFRRLFLCDGDALILPQDRLAALLEAVRTSLPWIRRVGTYGNAKSILRKTPQELASLQTLGLGIVYLGVETGHEPLLARIRKGVGYDRLVEAGRRIKEAGISLSVTVILGLGGVEGSMAHARDTARILTDIDPDYVGALTLMPIPGTPLYEEIEAARFVLPDAFGFLAELGVMLGQARFTDCLFTSNHASNYLPLRARLPGEREDAVETIGRVLASGSRHCLRPECLRAL